MNTVGCPEGLATDESLVAPSALCDTSLLAYDLLFGIFFGIRGLATVFQWTDWFRRRRAFLKKNTNARDTKRWRYRLPVGPVIGTICALAWLLIIILVRMNVANASNGAAFCLWMIGAISYMSTAAMFMRRIVRLGKRIIPMSKVNLDKLVKQDQSQNGSSRFDSLGTYDTFLRIVVVAMAVEFASMFVNGIVLSLVLPGEFAILQISYASVAALLFTVAIALTYQLQRVYLCVIGCAMFGESSRGPVVQKLRSQQTYMVTIGLGAAFGNILQASGVFPSRWYSLLFWMIAETSGSSLPVLEKIGSIFISGKRRVETSGGGDNNQALAAANVTATSSSKPEDTKPPTATQAESSSFHAAREGLSTEH